MGVYISIHALLAESDASIALNACCRRGFLSTLSLRRATVLCYQCFYADLISIHALLAESDAFWIPCGNAGIDFYPRSPCGERRCFIIFLHFATLFLSTLSLRRATLGQGPFPISWHYFYPRSPCGERPKKVRANLQL